jgi:hypothetical protein
LSSWSDYQNIDYVTQATQRFATWPQPTDFFNRTELATNWDLLDGILGRPDDDSQWPPALGVGGGIWKEIQDVIDMFDSRSAQIGDVKYWYRPSTSVPLSYITDQGWALADGSLVAAADHDFPGLATDIYLPDLVNKFVVGADPSRSLGAEPTDTAGPGPVLGTAGGNDGEGGSHAQSHVHTIDSHTHTTPNHTHTIPTHNHQVPEHYHQLGGTTGGTTSPLERVQRAAAETQQGVPPHEHDHALPATTRGFSPGSVATGSTAGHSFNTYGSGTLTTNSGGGSTTGGSGELTTSEPVEVGGSSEVELDNRPEHVGLLAFIKVRYV